MQTGGLSSLHATDFRITENISPTLTLSETDGISRVTPSRSGADGTSFTPSLSQADIEGVETFIFFVGWPRSCHSIVGTMLDAHPNVIIAHEYFIFSQNNIMELNRSRLYNELYRNSYMNARSGWRASNHTQKGYTLNMYSSWQGRFTKLWVIGDKSGGNTALVYLKNSRQFKVKYQHLRGSLRVPIKVLQVVRNPFDMIATNALYLGSSIPRAKVNATPTHKYDKLSILNQSVNDFIRRSTAVVHMTHELRLSPLQVYCEDLISDTAETISNICRFLDLECSREYLQMCTEKTFRNVSASHHLVKWNPTTVSTLKRSLKKFPFFKRYMDTQLSQ